MPTEGDAVQRCDGCAHWHRLAEIDAYSRSPAVDDFARWGRCARQDDWPTPLYSQDASDYLSWITTRDEFSCIEWRAGHVNNPIGAM